MIDENIDLTLNSIFAGENYSRLLPQRIRQNRENFGLDHSRATVRMIDTEALNIVDSTDGKRFKHGYSGKIQLEALGSDVDLENSIIWDGEVQAYASSKDSSKMYFVYCDCCGRRKEFSIDPLCDDCKERLDYEFKHKLESMKL